MDFIFLLLFFSCSLMMIKKGIIRSRKIWCIYNFNSSLRLSIEEEEAKWKKGKNELLSLIFLSNDSFFFLLLIVANKHKQTFFLHSKCDGKIAWNFFNFTLPWILRLSSSRFFPLYFLSHSRNELGGVKLFRQ